LRKDTHDTFTIDYMQVSATNGVEGRIWAGCRRGCCDDGYSKFIDFGLEGHNAQPHGRKLFFNCLVHVARLATKDRYCGQGATVLADGAAELAC
jgi:hypothetical protein